MSVKSKVKLGVAALFAAGMVAGAGAQELPQDGVYKDRIDWGLLMDPVSYTHLTLPTKA
mgnify:CR=1 FL=1